MNGVDILKAEEAVDNVISGLLDKNGISDEMEKVKNKFESSTVFSNTSILNKAMNLAFCELLGNADLINNEMQNYTNVTGDMVVETVRKHFTQSNSSVIYYKSGRTKQ